MPCQKWSYIIEPDINPPSYTTLPDLLREQALKTPDKHCCLYCSADGIQDSITFKNLLQYSHTFAKYLVTAGIQRECCVGLIGPNSIQWLIAEFGVVMAGGIVMNLTVSLKNASDVKEMIIESGMKCIIIGDIGKHLVDMVIKQAREMNLQIVRIQDTTEGIDNLSCILAQPESDVELPVIYPEDGAFVFTTSGSTGSPLYS